MNDIDFYDKFDFPTATQTLNCDLSVTFSVHVLVFELGVHRDPWPLTNSLNSSSNHTSLIVTIQGIPATTVGPTNS